MTFLSEQLLSIFVIVACTLEDAHCSVFLLQGLLALADHFLSICHCCTLAYTSHVVVMAGQQDCGWDVEGS